MGFFPLSKLYQDHKKFLAEREFEAMKECVSGKRKSFGSRNHYILPSKTCGPTVSSKAVD